MKDSRSIQSDILVVCPNPSVDTYIWMKQLKPKAVNRANDEKYFPGGKGVHVALALKELTTGVNLLGFWGGATGKWLIRECSDRGVPCFGPEVPGWTRICYTIKGSEDISDTEILGAGPLIISDDMRKFRVVFKECVSDHELVCMSGSWPGSSSDASYAGLIATAKEAGKKVFLDCSGSLLKEALSEKPFAIHINLNEGKALFNLSDPKAIAFELARYCDIAAVTAGEKGLFLVTAESCWHAYCRVDEVFSTVGSGDCLLAGLIYAYHNGMDMKELAQWGVACGAANCINKDLGMIKRSDVMSLLSKAEVRQLEAN